MTLGAGVETQLIVVTQQRTEDAEEAGTRFLQQVMASPKVRAGAEIHYSYGVMPYGTASYSALIILRA